MTQDEKIDKILEHILELKEAQAALDATRPLYIARIEHLEERADATEKQIARAEGAIKFISLLGVIMAIGAACRKMLQ